MERPILFELTGALGVYFLWLLARQLFLMYDIPPAEATAQIVAVGLFFAAVYVLPSRGEAAAERRERSGVRGMGKQWLWAILAAVTIAVLLTLLVEFYARVLPPEADDARYLAYVARPYGIMPALVGGIVVGGLVSEVVFRGWVQGRLTRAFGPEVGIINAAALFAVANLDLWFVPVYFALGLLAGYSVYLTRSVWSAVLISMAFNGGLFLADATLGDPALPTSPLANSIGQQAAVTAILATAVLTLFIFSRQRRLHDATASSDDTSGPTTAH